jgi:hypothetical protein
MSIFAQAVGPTNNPISFTSGSGTATQVINNGSVALVLTVGGQVLNGRPFNVVAQGYVKAHGATQTIKMGLQGAAYSTSAFSGTQLYEAATASGTLTAGTFYPWWLNASLQADNTSGILQGMVITVVNNVQGSTGSNILANTLTAITFGSNNVGTNVTQPLASAQTPALQFALTFKNSVSDTTQIISVMNFWAQSE